MMKLKKNGFVCPETKLENFCEEKFFLDDVNSSHDNLFSVYKLCVDYENGCEMFTSHNIIELAETVLVNKAEFSDLWDRCVFHLNNWNNQTIEEQCKESEEIIELLCNRLGEYFVD